MRPTAAHTSARRAEAAVGPDDRVLVVVAHPDDETFGCGSLIAHAASSGWPRSSCAVALANSLMRRWASEMATVDSASPYLGDLDALGSPDAELRVIDCTAQLAVREAAIAAHRSQHSPYDAISPSLRRDFLVTTFVRTLDP